MGKDATQWLPEELVTHVTAGCGQLGVEWLGNLPDIIRHLEKVWSIAVLEPFPGIEFNFVAPGVNRGSDAVVLKVAPPWEPIEIFSEAEYLRARDGDGCVKLLAEDHDHKAILLERVIPGQSLWEHFKDRETESLGPAIEVLRNILRPCSGKETHIARLDRWFDGLRKYPGSGFPEAYAKRALSLYEELAAGSPRDNYLHGDYHPGNVVTSGEREFIAIDPKGLEGNIGYDIAVFLNNYYWWQEKRSDVRKRLAAAIERFAAEFELSTVDVRRWAYAQAVLGAWWNFADMPSLYDGGVVKADIWDV